MNYEYILMYIVILSLSFLCAKFRKVLKKLAFPRKIRTELHRPHLRPTVSIYEVIAPNPGKLFLRRSLAISQGELWVLLFCILMIALIARSLRVFGLVTAIFINSLLIVFFVDFLEISGYWNFWYDSLPWLGTIFLVGLLIRKNYFYFVSIAFLAFNVSTLALIQIKEQESDNRETLHNELAQAKSARDIPPIVHIVIDEHIGLDGIPPDIPGSPEIRNHLIEYFKNNNFTIHTKSFSRYPSTELSLPTLFNFRSKYQNKFVEKVSKEGISKTSLMRNKYFQFLSEKGYSLNVYQSNVFNFCEGVKINQCIE
jgi:hypothetical protein